MYDPFTFKGKQFEQGDIVTMLTGSFPFEFQAAVVDYDVLTDTLEVMSTQLAITQHNGLFPSDDVEDIMITHKHDQEYGLATEARADLHRGQLCLVSGKYHATVTAAFDGMVTGRSLGTPGVNDGTVISGGSSYWQAA